jgi:hypothetical protein
MTIPELAIALQVRGLAASAWTVRRRVHRGELIPARVCPKTRAYQFDLEDALRQWLRGPAPL